MKRIIFYFFLFFLATSLFSQEYLKPNFALATHPMVIDKISVTDTLIRVTITLENHINNGEFCASEIIYIQELKKKKKAYLLKATGIPPCPKTYKFDKPGEKLNFTLDFFGFYEKPKFLNIVEDCDEHCFVIYGVILDSTMNHDIDMGFAFYKSGNPELSVNSFEKAVNENPDYPFGYLYENIIGLYLETEAYEQAHEWYQRLKNSTFADKDQILEQIRTNARFDKLKE